MFFVSFYIAIKAGSGYNDDVLYIKYSTYEKFVK